MSVENVSIILHELQYQTDSGMHAVLSPSLLPVNASVLDLASSLHQIFQAKTNKAYALFHNEEGEPTADGFPDIFKKYLNQSESLISLSAGASARLIESLNKYGLQCEGYLYFLTYSFLGADYLMIGVFETEETVLVGDALDIKKVKHIDLTKMGLAARIDITEFTRIAESRKYISFIKGRAGRKVADFFLEFLSAVEGIDLRLQNQTLVRAIDSYAEEQHIDMPQMQEARQAVMQYCKEQIKTGEELETRRIAELIPAAEETDFYTFLSQEVGLPESFPPSASTLRTMTKFVGSGGGLTISFDEKLLGERIRYDSQRDELTIVGLPPNLKDQLLRRQH
ncbi:nucleoid-associated protein YejK [Pseudaeromonas sharmana]|uniref:Nucleoid-associated protein YejK n=1 Tax=Pseudaeromonas sharmana TaxID=328412 RepID=A0ABV8CS38_9GAMM